MPELVHRRIWDTQAKTQGPWKFGIKGLIVYQSGWPSLLNAMETCAKNNFCSFFVAQNGQVWQTYRNLDEWGFHPKPVKDIQCQRYFSVELLTFGKLTKIGSRLFRDDSVLSEDVPLRQSKHLNPDARDDLGGWYHIATQAQIDSLIRLCGFLIKRVTEDDPIIVSSLELLSRDGRQTGFMPCSYSMPQIREIVFAEYGVRSRPW